MMSRGKMTLDPTAEYSRVNMTNVCTGDPVRVRWDNGAHFEATVCKRNSDGTVAVTYLDGASAKQYAPYVTTPQGRYMDYKERTQRPESSSLWPTTATYSRASLGKLSTPRSRSWLRMMVPPLCTLAEA